MRRTPQIKDNAPEAPDSDHKSPRHKKVVNRTGDAETTSVNHKGQTERTFNERDSNSGCDTCLLLCAEQQICPDCGKDNSGSQNSSSQVERFAEDFTGTGAIALAPAAFTTAKATAKKKKPEKQMANPTRKPKTALREEEWTGDVKGAGHQMDRLGGDSGSVFQKSSKKDDTGKRDTKMSEVMGKDLLKGKHKNGIAMGDVDSDGVEGESQGDHESSHAEANDNVTSKTGHNWPQQPKNKGGQWEEFGNHIEGAELTSKTSTAESWDPDKIGNVMAEDGLSLSELQRLFDSYARSTDCVSLEGFGELLDAHGLDNVLDEASFHQLLNTNAEFMFREMADADGAYWIAEGLPESLKKHQFKAKGDGGSKGEKGTDSKKDSKPAFLKGKGKSDKNKKPVEECNKVCKEWLEIASGIAEYRQKGDITEGVARRALQLSLNCNLTRSHLSGCSENVRLAVAQVARENKLSIDNEIQTVVEGMYDFEGGAPSGPGADPYGKPMGQVGPDDPMGAFGAPEGDGTPDQGGPMPSGVPGLGPESQLHAGMEEPGMQVPGQEELPPMDDDFGFNQPGAQQRPGSGIDDFELNPEMGDDSDDIGIGDLPMGPSSQMGNRGGGGLGMQPSPFENRSQSGRTLAEELSGDGHQMTHVGEKGKSVADSKPSKSSNLPQDDTDMEEVCGKDLLGAKQHNVGQDRTEHPAEFKDGGEGIMGEKDGLEENLNRLQVAVHRYLAEHSHGLRGKFKLGFSTKVNGKRVSSSVMLPEALADCEEALLLYGVDKVALEAAYLSPAGKVLHRADIQLPRLARRGPAFSEGKVAFRFSEHAELFADKLVQEGIACRVSAHNWGTAVSTSTTPAKIHRAFRQLIK